MTFASVSIFDFDQDYCTSFKRFGIRGSEVFSDLTAGVFSDRTREKIGVVDDILADQSGQIKDLIIELDFRNSGRKVLLPAQRAWIDHKNDRVYAAGLSKREAEKLPEYRAAL